MKAVPYLSVNADDFGYSPQINEAIVTSLQRGWVHSASLMTNAAYMDEACALVRQHQWNGRVGVHLNLTEGLPLTAAIRACRLYCDERGQFRGIRRRRLTLSHDAAAALETELEAQIRACLERGVQPSHLDSHHHVHYAWPICGLLIKLAQRHGISAIRIYRNSGRSTNPLKSAYTALFNARLRQLRLARSVYFGYWDDMLAPPAAWLKACRSHDSTDEKPFCEIMAHPDLNSQGQVIEGASPDKEQAPLLVSLVNKIDAWRAAL